MLSYTSNSKLIRVVRRNGPVWLCILVLLILWSVWLILTPPPLPKKGPFFSCEVSPITHAYQTLCPFPVKFLTSSADIIVTGDSKVTVGICPTILSKNVGGKVVLLANPANEGGQLVEQTNSLLAFTPKRLVLSYSPLSIYVTQLDNTKKKHESEWMLSRKILDNTMLMMMARIRSYLVRPFTFKSGFPHDKQLEFYFSPMTLSSSAYTSDYLKADYFVEAYKMLLSDGEENREKNINILHNNLKTLKEKGWSIVCIQMPSSQEIIKVQEEFFPSEIFESICRKRNIPYLDYSQRDFKTYDGIHMEGEQSRKFTLLLGEDLRAKCGW